MEHLYPGIVGKAGWDGRWRSILSSEEQDFIHVVFTLDQEWSEKYVFIVEGGGFKLAAGGLRSVCRDFSCNLLAVAAAFAIRCWHLTSGRSDHGGPGFPLTHTELTQGSGCPLQAAPAPSPLFPPSPPPPATRGARAPVLYSGLMLLFFLEKVNISLYLCLCHW